MSTKRPPTPYISDLAAYHKIITDSYDERSKNYNNSEWHRNMAHQLVDYAPPPEQGRVLDIGTGTGSVAFHSASITGPAGEITGVDISTGMIAKAQELLDASNINNIQFQVADGEALSLPPNYYDRVYCASAFFWMSNKVGALSHWHRFLKPGGIVGFHAWPNETFIWGYLAREILQKYGIEYLAHTPYGSVEICTQLLEQSGYQNIDIKLVESGSYLTLEDALDSWVTEDDYPIGQYPHPVSITPPDILESAKADYQNEMRKLNTEKGIWNNTSTYFVYGEKPKDE